MSNHQLMNVKLRRSAPFHLHLLRLFHPTLLLYNERPNKGHWQCQWKCSQLCIRLHSLPDLSDGEHVAVSGLEEKFEESRSIVVFLHMTFAHFSHATSQVTHLDCARFVVHCWIWRLHDNQSVEEKIKQQRVIKSVVHKTKNPCRALNYRLITQYALTITQPIWIF